MLFTHLLFRFHWYWYYYAIIIYYWLFIDIDISSAIFAIYYSFIFLLLLIADFRQPFSFIRCCFIRAIMIFSFYEYWCLFFHYASRCHLFHYYAFRIFFPSLIDDFISSFIDDIAFLFHLFISLSLITLLPLLIHWLFSHYAIALLLSFIDFHYCASFWLFSFIDISSASSALLFLSFDFHWHFSFDYFHWFSFAISPCHYCRLFRH